MALYFPLDTHDDWQINVDQYRVHTGPELAVGAFTEGPHQDDCDFVAIAVITRCSITGAEMTLLPLGGESESFFF